jgi:hypothetical protein
MRRAFATCAHSGARNLVTSEISLTIVGIQHRLARIDQELTLRSRPSDQRRHRRENGFNIAARFEPENSSPVIEQVELDIASASY